MKIVHTYSLNMIGSQDDKDYFLLKWGLLPLAKAGHEVTLICGSSTKKRKEYIWNDVKIIELPVMINFTDSTRILKGFFRELMKIKVDIFHSHHYCSFIPELTLLVGKIRQKPVFLSLHNSFLEGGTIAKSLGLIYLIFLQLFIPFYDKTFFVSHYLKNKKRFLMCKNKTVIYNYFSLPPAMNIKRKNNTILFMGRIMHQKGIDILIKALSLVKKDIFNIHLNVAGSGPQKYIDELKRLVIKLDLSENVTFHGFLEGKKWEQYYSNSVLVVPSRDEGFGNVVIEGMLAEIPIIVSNKGSLPEASGGKGIVFNINSPKDLSNKIISLFNAPKYCQKLVYDAKIYALKFTDESKGKDVERLLRGFE